MEDSREWGARIVGNTIFHLGFLLEFSDISPLKKT